MAMQSAAAAEYELFRARLKADRARQLHQQQVAERQSRRSEEVSLTARDVGVGVAAASGYVSLWFLCAFAVFGVLALGPVGLILLLAFAGGSK